MKFKFDPRELPDNLKSPEAEKAFTDSVLDLLQDSASGVQPDASLFAAIVGMLVLDGATDPSAASFDNAFWTVRGESAGSTDSSEPSNPKLPPKPNKEIYQDVAEKISKFAGHKGTVYFQELAYVSRKLLTNADTIPYDDPTFSGQIRVYDDEYVANGPQGAAGLDIPDLTSADSGAGPDDIRPANIQAVSVIFAAYNLEQARLFDVVDRIMETWWNGQLPTGFDRGSKVLDDLYWSSEFRLTPSARHMQYSRVLGVPGGEVSTEVQPNTPFMDGLTRAAATLVEYDRKQGVAEVVGSQSNVGLSSTAEMVRQNFRLVASNASLYGWGGTQFAARRLADHIKKAFAVLNTPEIQAAYGVDGPWKVVEKVAPEIGGGVPNIVKWRGLAASGKAMLDIVAKYSTIWSGSTGLPLFDDTAASQQTQAVQKLGVGFDALTAELHQLTSIIATATKTHTTGATTAVSTNTGAASSGIATASKTADISDADRDELIRQAGIFVVGKGIKDDTVEELSQPFEAQYSPSLPTLTAPAPSTNGNAGLQQLQQMAMQGQLPTSIDQLRSLVLPAGQ